MTFRVLALIAIVWSQVAIADAPEWLLGRWVLNNELTKAAQPEGKETKNSSGGFGRPSITIGGMPVPGTGGSVSGPISNAPAKEPGILRCSEFTAVAVGNELLLTYVGAGSDQLKSGNDQGRKTKWNRSKLTSSYETTTRRVTQTYQLEKDGRLTVTVKLNPKQGATVVTKRVFERPTSAATAAAAAPSAD